MLQDTLNGFKFFSLHQSTITLYKLDPFPLDRRQTINFDTSIYETGLMSWVFLNRNEIMFSGVRELCYSGTESKTTKLVYIYDVK